MSTPARLYGRSVFKDSAGPCSNVRLSPLRSVRLRVAHHRRGRGPALFRGERDPVVVSGDPQIRGRLSAVKGRIEQRFARDGGALQLRDDGARVKAIRAPYECEERRGLGLGLQQKGQLSDPSSSVFFCAFASSTSGGRREGGHATGEAWLRRASRG